MIFTYSIEIFALILNYTKPHIPFFSYIYFWNLLHTSFILTASKYVFYCLKHLNGGQPKAILS